MIPETSSLTHGVSRRTVLKAAGAGAVATPAAIGRAAADHDCDFGGGAEIGEFVAVHRAADGSVLDVFEVPDGEDDADFRVEPEDVGATLELRGEFVEFDVVLDTLAVRDYGFTADHPLMTGDEAVTIFARKLPEHGATLDDELRLSVRSKEDGGRARIRRDSSADVDMSIQTKDHTQGGIFQMEPEPATEFLHELADGFHYFFDDRGRVILTNDPADDHELTCHRVLARESPQQATLLGDGDGGELEHGDTTSRWQVDSGGRAGFVAGEDALE